MMRWLIGIVAVLVTLWCGWWFAGRYVILSQTDQLIADQRAAGATLEVPGFSLAGFPSRFDLSADSISYTDPSGRISYQGGTAFAYALSWKPWHLVFWLPDSQQITLDGQQVNLDGKSVHASLRASPSLDLPLALAAFSADSLTVTPAAGPSIGIGPLSLRVEAETGASGQGHPYRIGATLNEIRPDPALIGAIATTVVPQMPATTLPDVIGRLHLDATVALTAPLDRHAGAAKPHILSLDLRDLGLNWGELQMSASGTLTPDDQGFAAGTISLSVRGWEQLPRLLVGAGVMEARMAGVLTNVMRGIASQNSDPAVLVMPLVLKDGWVAFGPLPLGQAPQLGALPSPAG